MEIDILGSVWKIIYGTEKEFPNLKDNDGYADSSVREIIINSMMDFEKDVSAKKNLDSYRNRVLRHEIIHAFLCESGLDGNGLYSDHWEFNEEMIDWFAIQSPKIFHVFTKLQIMEGINGKQNKNKKV